MRSPAAARSDWSQRGRSAKGRVRNGRARDGTAFRTLLIVVSLVAAAGVIGWFAATESMDPRFALHTVKVTGAMRTDPQAVVMAAALPVGANIWLLDTRKAVTRVEVLPWVATASIRRSWPNGVRIAIVERAPVARIPLPGNVEDPASSWAVIDAGSRILSVGTLDARDAVLPSFVIRGAAREAYEPGARLTDSDLARALAAESALARLGVRVSEIDIDAVFGVEAVDDLGVRVAFGSLDNLIRKVGLAHTIESRIADPARIEYIDVRALNAPTVSYR